MLDSEIYGLHPWGFHLTNVLLHALNAVLVFLVFRKLMGNDVRSLILAFLFALHPLRVESVTWISERKDVLSAMFWLLAMCAYAGFAERRKSGSRNWKAPYLLALLFFGMGLMSKTMLVTLPFVFLMLDHWPLKRSPSSGWSKLVIEKVPFFLLTVAVSIVEYIAQRDSGALGEMSHLTAADRLENAVVSYVRYIGKFFWPENLCVLYPHPGHWPMLTVFLSGLAIAAISIFAWRSRETAPYLFFGWFWFLGTFVPVINLIQLGSQSIADRYTYVPMIGFAFILVWGIAELTQPGRFRVWIISTAVTAALGGCFLMTRYEIRFWKDDLTLWNHALAVTENNYAAHDCLGGLLRDAQPDESFAHLQEAVRINPDYADAQRSLAAELFDRGRFEEAAAHYQKSLELDPVCAWAETGLGLALYRIGKSDEYLPHLEKAVQYEPDNAGRQDLLGIALYEKQKPADAIDHLRKAVLLEPKNAKYQVDLGTALSEQGQLDEAITCLQAALQIQPDSVNARQSLETAIELKKQRQSTNAP